VEKGSGRERRRYYRLYYPFGIRPVLTTYACSYHVTEISEGGIRFIVRRRTTYERGDRIKAAIAFKDGECLEVIGTVLRVEDNEVVVQLTKGITFKRMVEEQKLILKSYPQVKSQR
jgi:hypothetical protein